MATRGHFGRHVGSLAGLFYVISSTSCVKVDLNYVNFDNLFFRFRPLLILCLIIIRSFSTENWALVPAVNLNSCYDYFPLV